MVFDAVARHTTGPLPLDPFLDAMHLPAGAHDSDGENSPMREELANGLVVADEDWKGLEKLNLLNALQKAHWKVAGKGGAAELLGVKPSTLESRMKALAIERPQ
jgi:transcriptional regulator with GAF, ATPase, and Fis domain